MRETTLPDERIDMTTTPCLAVPVLVASLLAVALGLGGAAAAAPPHTAAARDVVHGWAAVGRPVAGATVSVHSPSGRLLARERRSTNVHGTFAVPVRGLPASYRVVVTGGHKHGARWHGHLIAVVRGDKGAVVDLNPVTTVIARYLQAHPSATVARAEDRVEDLLEIPNALAPGDLRISAGEYRDGRLLGAARRPGAFDALTERLARRAGREQPAGQAAVSADDSAGQRLTQSGPALTGIADDVAERMLDELIAGAKDKAKESLTGWLLSALRPGGGGIDPTQAQLRRISEQLQVVNAQLVDIKRLLGQIEGDLKLLGYQAVIDKLPLAQIDHFRNEQAWIANAAAGIDRDHAVTDLTAYVRANLLDAPELFQRAYTGGFDGIKLIPAYGQVALKLGPNYPFFTGADSNKVAAATRYFDSYLVQALDAIVEVRHQDGETQRPADLLARVAGLRATQFKPTYPAVLPSDPVLVDSRSGVMWTSNTPWIKLVEAQQLMATMNARPLKGWSFPSFAELNGLLVDPRGSDACKWLAAHGFYFRFEGNVDCSTGLWTREPGCPVETMRWAVPWLIGDVAKTWCDTTWPGYRSWTLLNRRPAAGERYW